MSKDAFARKYRPKKLADLVGQEHVVKVLLNSLKQDNYHHAYIFAGKFGCGKTSTARIFAAAVNNPGGASAEPDLSSELIKRIFEGKHPDIKEIDAAASGSIDGIRDLKEQIKYAPMECKYRFVILDECLSKETRVDTDIGRIPIGVIVNNKLTPKVKSYNHDTGKVEYKEITGWFVNSGKDVYKVAFEGRGAVYASDGHLFATPNGYFPLRNLRVGDQVLRVGKSILPVQRQIILGSLLGDMNIQRNSSKSQKRKDAICRARLKMVHCLKQFEYLEFKKDILEQNSLFSFSKRDFLHSGFEGYEPKPMRTYTSKTSSALSEIFTTVIDTSKKRPCKTITRKWLDQIDNLGLAIWFCDDGSVNRTKTKNGFNPVVSFHTQGFTKQENKVIAEWLISKGYNANVRSSGKRNLWQINLTTDSSRLFLENISAYVHASMRYKLKDIDGLADFDISLYDNETSDSSEVVTEVITTIKKLGYRSRTYDLEIEDNHNYFCSDTLVHNCHRLSGAAAEAALKMIEEPPSNVIFILCIAEGQKVFTVQGFKNIEEVQPGDEIYTEEGFSRVKARYDKGVAKTVTIMTERGSRIRVTPNHRMRVFDGNNIVWKAASDLSETDQLPIFHSYAQSMNSASGLSSDECVFLGRLVGDGYYTNGKLGILFNNDELSYGANLLNRLGYAFKDYATETCHDLYIYDRPNIKSRYGLEDYERGNKVLPKIVYSMNSQQIEQFLSGLIGADGSVDKNGYRRLYSNNMELMSELKNVLNAHGYHVNLRETYREIIDPSPLTGIKPGTYKSGCMLFLMREPSIRISNNLRQDWGDLYPSCRRLKYKTGNGKFYHLRRDMLEGVPGETAAYFRKSCSFERVKSIEIDDSVPVYDLEMDNASESFVVEGFSVHNCTTDPQKLKDTIHSRCLPLRFNALSWNQAFQHLCKVADAEKIDYDEVALKIAARKSKGSARNALQNLQMLVTFAGEGNKITSEIAQQALSAIDENFFFHLVDAIVKPDAGEAMRIVDKLLVDGRDVGEVLDGLVGHLRNLLVITTAPSTQGLIYLTDDEQKRYMHQRNSLPSGLAAAFIIEALENLAETSRSIQLNLNPQVMLEGFVVKTIMSAATLRRKDTSRSQSTNASTQPQKAE